MNVKSSEDADVSWWWILTFKPMTFSTTWKNFKMKVKRKNCLILAFSPTIVQFDFAIVEVILVPGFNMLLMSTVAELMRM